MKYVVRIAAYFGMGFLALWLWIGNTVDLIHGGAFPWVCLLLGPFMVLLWSVIKVSYVLLTFMVLSLVGAALFLVYDFWRIKRRDQKFIQDFLKLRDAERNARQAKQGTHP